MNSTHFRFIHFLLAALLLSPLAARAQDDDLFALEGVETDIEEQPVVKNEASAGLYYLDHDSYRYGKYTGLVDEGFYALVDFRIEKRPLWDSGDTKRWRFQGWRLGLDSRRLVYDYSDQVKQSFKADYREIPNYRFSDGQSPYRGIGGNTLTLPSSWAVTPGSSNTAGFETLQQNLADVKIDTKRRWLELTYGVKLSQHWNFAVNYNYIAKKGERTIGSIFGYTGGNPRSVILPAPVDYKTNNVEAMFNYATARTQFGLGVYASFFSNDETSLIWQNAYGRQPQWAPSVEYPGSQGALALEPDNSYLQFKGYGAINFTAGTRLSADFSFGQMEQDDDLLPYSINPDLIVTIPVPLTSLDAKIKTSHFNVRLTSRLGRRANLALNYRYEDRDNKTPREVYPYIGGDSQNQRPYEDGRINLPYSTTRQKADAILTYGLGSGIRLKGGAEYIDISRDYSEVANSDEWAWLAGIRFGGFETASFNFDYRYSSRDVDLYVGNTPFIESHVPGTVSEDEWENQPLLRKYFLTDRDRSEFRFRSDVFPNPQWNFGLTLAFFKDDYAEGFYGLNEAKVQSGTIDLGWYPVEDVSLTAYYTREKYDAEQSSISFNNTVAAFDPSNNWYADTTDKADTYNVSLAFSNIGKGRGWTTFNMGFGYTLSDTRSNIDVTAVTRPTAPLPTLVSKLNSFSAWGDVAVGERSSIRLVIEASKLDTSDFALDNVVPDTLANVLLLGESAANYDLILITGSWTYQF